MKYYCKTLARDTIRLASFSPSGKRIITGATDGVIRLLHTPSREDVLNGLPFPTLQPYVYYLEEHEGYVNSLHFSLDGTEFLTGSWDGTVRLWNYSNGSWTGTVYDTISPSEKASFPKGKKVTMVSFANKDQLIVAAINHSFSIIVFEKESRRLIQAHKFHTSDIQILTCHPIHDHIILSASYDGRVALWNTRSGKQIFGTINVFV